MSQQRAFTLPFTHGVHILLDAEVVHVFKECDRASDLLVSFGRAN